MYSFYKKACQYVESLIPKAAKWKFSGELGMNRMRAVLKELQDPQNSFKSIHVAGTSGKGSTAYLVAKILQKNGLKIGLHLSPHLQTIRERMILNNRLVSKKEFVDLVNEVAPVIKKVSKQFKYPVTYFECLLAMTFLYFKKGGVDFAVVETGLGGAYDGTNVLNSVLTIITKIGFDHMKILGKTIPEIASQKAGIIKKNNIACISQKQLPEAEIIIKNVARSKGVPLFFENTDFFLTIHSITNKGCLFSYKYQNNDIKNISLSLLGKHQVDNAAAAISAVQALRKIGIKIDNNKIKQALSEAHFPGRIELLKRNDQKWILDGAHNEDKIGALTGVLDIIFPKTDKIAIVAFKKDKDINTCLRLLFPYFSTIICTRFHVLTDVGNQMAIKPQQLKIQLISLGFKGNVVIKSCVKDAIEYTENFIDKKTLHIITGSLYLVGEARSTLGLTFSI